MGGRAAASRQNGDERREPVRHAMLRTMSPSRHPRRRYRSVLAALALGAASCGSGPGEGDAAQPSGAPAGLRVLVFSRTAGFRHSSIPSGVDAISAVGAEEGFAVDATEDAARFSDAGLAPYRIVVWLSTSGDVLDGSQQAAFERWVRAGGGFVGVQAAADTEYDWPFYGALVGTYFSHHPEPGPGTLVVEDRTHPSTAHLAPTWARTDEWYSFRAPPRAGTRVLLSRAVPDGEAAQPLAWCGNYEGGRSWYTALGHGEEAFTEPAFRQHLRGGIASVAGGSVSC
jgi:type 1 glutamine amidotransferase